MKSNKFKMLILERIEFIAAVSNAPVTPITKKHVCKMHSNNTFTSNSLLIKHQITNLRKTLMIRCSAERFRRQLQYRPRSSQRRRS